jgi:hypothetical protein
MKKGQQSTLVIISFALVCVIAVVGIALLLADPGVLRRSTPTPALSLDQIIAATGNAAATQTMAFAPPSSTPLPSETPTLVATFTPIPTDTPFVITASSPEWAQGCTCHMDVYNCGDPEVEVCFTVCKAQGYQDIHKLDSDNDGVACEEN